MNVPSDPVWTELGNIDYFLEHLALAVELGEIDRSGYDAVAPPYFTRRAELVAVLESRMARSSQPVQATGVSTPTPAATSQRQPIVIPSVTPIQVNWTGVLTVVGALLVIIASAIFAIATWDSFSVEFRIGFLGLLTAGFYLAGALVRTRFHLPAAGVALTVVGSAMLLFDGWIVIDGYGFSGAWPWVGWLTVCSAIYWFTEVRVTGQFFGAIGAAAQIAWVWLLGAGLGWTTGPRMAGIALVALAWTLAGRMAKDSPILGSLAQVLRSAGPVAVGVAALGVAVDLGIGPVGWTQVTSAVIVGTCATTIADLTRLPRGIAAVVYLPAFAAIASMVAFSGAALGHVVLLGFMAMAYLLYEVVRGGWGHGALALFAQIGMLGVLALRYEWAPDVLVAVLAALAAMWLIGATFAGRVERISWPGLLGMRQVMASGGYILLLAATGMIPLVREALPLAGTTIEPRDVILAVFVTALWWLVTVLREESGPGIIALAGLFYSTMALIAWLFPESHSSLYATVLVAECAALTVAYSWLGHTLKLPKEGIAVSMRVLVTLFLVVGFIASEYFFDLRSWEAGVLAGVAAAFWIVDALLAEKSRMGMGVSSALIILSVVLFAWRGGAIGDGASRAAVYGALAAVILSGFGLLLDRERGLRDSWLLGAAVAGTACVLPTMDESGLLAIALVLAAIGWIPVARALVPEVAALSGALGIAALFAALAHFNGPAWVTVTAALIATGLALVPSFLRFGDRSETARRTVRSLAGSGLVGPVLLLAFATPELAGFDAGRWAQIGEQGVVVSLCGLGAYGVIVGLLYRFEPAVYAGGIAFVAAVWGELGAFDIGQVAAFTTPLAVYLMWAGMRWRRATGRPTAPGFDVAATFVGLVPASLAAISSGSGGPAIAELGWALGLALVAISLGVMLRVRAYFFGGSAALVFVAIGRSWIYLVELWWLVLGLIGIAMLVIAIAWSRQQTLAGDARQRVSDTFGGWR